MINRILAEHFMPQDRKNGEDLFNNDSVTITCTSETQTRAYLKAPGAPRVSLSTENIFRSDFQADCTCSLGKKGKLCKHIWATLLKLETLDSDFLACKTIIEKSAAHPKSNAKLAAKARQAEYHQQRKEQNKARNKKIRREKKLGQSTSGNTMPENVQAALSYFSTNGFELSHPFQIEDLDAARKSLARIFHPDKGGTHAEILLLYQNHDIISAYIAAKT